MKFTNLFTLLAVSSVLAYDIDYNQNSEEAFVPNDIIYPRLLPETQECQDSYKEISNLIYNASDNLEDACKTYNPDELKTVLEKAENICQDAKILASTRIGITRILCSKDESGNKCGVSKYVNDMSDLSFINEADKIVQETCKSKLCTEQLREGLEDFIVDLENERLYDDIKIINQFVEKLNDKTCTDAQAAPTQNTQNASSSATHIKVGSALLFTLGLVLSYF